MAIEILSSGTAERDRGLKRKLYAKYGVKEYWIVDPEGKNITIYENRAGKFVLAEEVEEGKVESRVIPGFELEAKDLW